METVGLVETKSPAELMEDFFVVLDNQELTVGQHLGRFQIPYWIIALRQSHEAKGKKGPTRTEIREEVIACVQMNDEIVCARVLSVLRARKRAHYCRFLSEMFCVFLADRGVVTKLVLIPHLKQNHWGVEIIETGEVLQVWPEWERRVAGKATID